MKTKKVSISIFQILIFILIVIAIIIIIVAIVNNKNKHNNVSELEHQFVGTGTLEDPYRIEEIEDFVKLLTNISEGNSYKDIYFKLMNKLDFLDDASYLDINSTTYGDLNQDGNVTGIKNELTTGNGIFGIINKYVEISDDGTIIHSFEGNFDGDNKQIKVI